MGTFFEVLCLLCDVQVVNGDDASEVMKGRSSLKNKLMTEDLLKINDGYQGLELIPPEHEHDDDYTIDIKGNLGASKLYDDCKTTLTIRGDIKNSRVVAHSTSRTSESRSFKPIFKPKKPIIVPCQKTFLHEGNLNNRIIIHSDVNYYEGIYLFFRFKITSLSS